MLFWIFTRNGIPLSRSRKQGNMLEPRRKTNWRNERNCLFIQRTETGSTCRKARSRSCTVYGSGGYSYHIVTHDRNKKCYRHSTHCGRYLSELKVGTFHPKTLYTCIHQHHSNCWKIFFRQFMYVHTTDKITKEKPLYDL